MSTYVLKHKPSSLKQALEDLHRMGIEAFAPMEYRRVRENRHRKTKTAKAFPALPGYVFVTCDVRTLYAHGVHAKGIAYVLGCEGRPLALPEAERLALVSLHQDRPSIPVARGLSPGDKVMITDGPFAGKLAKVSRVENTKLVRVLADWLGSLSAITIAADKLEAA